MFLPPQLPSRISIDFWGSPLESSWEDEATYGKIVILQLLSQRNSRRDTRNSAQKKSIKKYKVPHTVRTQHRLLPHVASPSYQSPTLILSFTVRLKLSILDVELNSHLGVYTSLAGAISTERL